jgi:hypothetical protein
VGGVDALMRVREEAGVRLDGVLKGRAVDHNGERHQSFEAAGEDHRAHDEVVGQRDIGSNPLGDLAHRFDVRVEVAVELLLAQLGEGPGVHTLVAVRDVGGQHRARRLVGRRCSGPARAASGP